MQTYLRSCAGPRVHARLLIRPTTLAFCLSSTYFLTTLCICISLQHPIIAHISWCQCGTIDDLCTHLLRCPYKSECIVVHNKFQDVVVAIVLESGAHIQNEVSHLFPHHTL
jgi:hypothetical protein